MILEGLCGVYSLVFLIVFLEGLDVTCLAKLDGKAVRFVLFCKSNYLGSCTIEKLLNFELFPM